jgi:hypothetical protein
MRNLVLAALLICSNASLAFAEECQAPCVGTTITFGLDGASIFASSPLDTNHHSIQPDVTIESYLQATENFKFVSTTVLEQVVDPPEGENSSFENLGAYQSELYAEFTAGSWTLLAGKFSPVFSLAADQGDGINGAGLAGNVDMGESLGGGLSYDFDFAGQALTLTSAAFTVDRSFLARSTFTRRDVPSLSDGGAGNTSGVSSVSLLLDGCYGAATGDCHDDGMFGYRLGARFQQHGIQTADQVDENILPRDEWAFVGGLQSNTKFGDNTLRLMTEASYIKNAGSNPVDAIILTDIASYVVGDFTYSASIARQFNLLAGPNTSSSLAELAVKYSPESELGIANSKWSVEAGYNYAVDEEKQKEHLLELKLNLELGGTYEFR